MDISHIIANIIKPGKAMPLDELSDTIAEELARHVQTYLDDIHFFSSPQEEEKVAAVADFFRTRRESRLRHAGISKNTAESIIQTNEKVAVYAEHESRLITIAEAPSYTALGNAVAEYLAFFYQAFGRAESEVLFSLRRLVENSAKRYPHDMDDAQLPELTPELEAFLTAFEESQERLRRLHTETENNNALSEPTPSGPEGIVIPFPTRRK